MLCTTVTDFVLSCYNIKLLLCDRAWEKGPCRRAKNLNGYISI